MRTMAQLRRHRYFARVPARLAEVKPMTKLITASQFADPDAAYLALVEARRNLSDTEAAELDARLVLILANHVGDLDALREAIALAKQTA
jgi:hypothetical protein